VENYKKVPLRCPYMYRRSTGVFENLNVKGARTFTGVVLHPVGINFRRNKGLENMQRI